MKDSEHAMLVEAGIYPAHDNHKRALDSVWGFMTMVESILSGNKRWTIHELLHDWCITSFQEDIEDEPDFVNHTIGRLMAHLIMNGHKSFMAVPPRAFIPVYKQVMSDDWWNESDQVVRETVYTICDIFELTPYQYTLTE